MAAASDCSQQSDGSADSATTSHPAIPSHPANRARSLPTPRPHKRRASSYTHPHAGKVTTTLGSFDLEYGIDAPLGRGASSIVYRCHLRDGNDPQPRAVKHIQWTRMCRDTYWMCWWEVQNLQRLESCKHVVRLERAYFEARQAFLVLRLLDEGMTLADFLRSRATNTTQRAPMALPDLRHLARELLQGVAGIHRRGVCHLDLKPANIWVALRPGALLRTAAVTLLDFGLSQPFQPGGAPLMLRPAAVAGSGLYMAPEVTAAWSALRAGGGFAPFDGAAADAWSAGVVLHAARFGSPPLRPAADAPDWWADLASLHAAWAEGEQHMRVGASQQLECNKDEQSFWAGVLHPDPCKRFTAEEALGHSFLQAC